MAASLPDTVAEYLARHHVLTLATCGPDGPWAAAVFYVNDGSALFFLSSATSRHGRNLALDPRCAATIHEDEADWTRIKGVQLEGRVSQLRGDEALRARAHYGRKFPLVASLAAAPPAIVAALAKVSWYRLDAERMHFIDNSRGFGHRDEIVLRQAGGPA